MNNIFEGIPAQLPVELVTVLIQESGVRLERIVSRGHTAPDSGWYDQADNEWVMVLQGRAVIAYPDLPQVELVAGDYLFIPAGQKHRVAWTDPTIDTIWLALFFPVVKPAKLFS